MLVNLAGYRLLIQKFFCDGVGPQSCQVSTFGEAIPLLQGR
jgi:hypothetical protein